MKKNPFLLFTLACALSLAVAGCVSTSPPRLTGPDQDQKSERPLLPQVAEAFEKGDYAAVERHLSDEMRLNLTRERFNAMREDLARNGEIKSIVYVTDLENPVIASELWKIRCVRSDEDGREIVSERLLRVVTGTLDGRTQVIGLMIQ